MEEWMTDACEQIDAGFFSGDSLHNQEAVNDMEYYLDRWEKELSNIKQLLKEKEESEGK